MFLVSSSRTDSLSILWFFGITFFVIHSFTQPRGISAVHNLPTRDNKHFYCPCWIIITLCHRRHIEPGTKHLKIFFKCIFLNQNRRVLNKISLNLRHSESVCYLRHDIHAVPGNWSNLLPQVSILLYIADWVVRILWKRGNDPDNFSIPYVTALGDLLGTGLLTAAFAVLTQIRHGFVDVSQGWF